MIDWSEFGDVATDLMIVSRSPGDEAERERLAAALLFALIGIFGADRLDRYALPSRNDDEEDPSSSASG